MTYVQSRSYLTSSRRLHGSRRLERMSGLLRALTRTAIVCAPCLSYMMGISVCGGDFSYTPTVLRIRPTSARIFLAISKICPWTRPCVV